jgi:hypothetical protein
MLVQYRKIGGTKNHFIVYAMRSIIYPIFNLVIHEPATRFWPQSMDHQRTPLAGLSPLNNFILKIPMVMLTIIVLHHRKAIDVEFDHKLISPPSKGCHKF